MTMPTAESNTRAIALARGFVIEKRGRRLVAVDPKSGETAATAADWPRMLREMIRAPRRDDGGDAA